MVEESGYREMFSGVRFQTRTCQLISYLKFGAHTIGKLFNFLIWPSNNFRRKIVFIKILVHRVGHTDNIKNSFVFKFYRNSRKVKSDTVMGIN